MKFMPLDKVLLYILLELSWDMIFKDPFSGGSATLQKAVAQRSVSFFQLHYRKVTVSAEIFNLTLSVFSETTKKTLL
jgi:hypothetical protein